jgi:hypothetical protein
MRLDGPFNIYKERDLYYAVGASGRSNTCSEGVPRWRVAEILVALAGVEVTIFHLEREFARTLDIEAC